MKPGSRSSLFGIVIAALGLVLGACGDSKTGDDDPQTVAAPTFSPDGGNAFTASVEVTLASATDGASIFYTTNGDDPSDTVGTLYAGPFTILDAVGTVTVKAVAYKDGMDHSTITVRTFTRLAPGQVVAPEFSLAPGSYTSAQNVALTTTTNNAVIYYTISASGTDPLDPTTSSIEYSAVISLDQPADPGTSTEYRIKAFAVAAGMVDSLVSSATYTISRPAAPVAVNLLANISTMEAAWAADSKYWNNWGGTGRAVTAGTYAGMTGGCLQVTATSFGTNPWDVQLAAGDTTTWTVRTITLQAGKKYTIRAKGAASGNVTITAILQKSDNSNADSLSMALTSTTQTFESSTPFVPTADTDVKFMINLGGLPANTIVYIDDVELIEADAP